MRWGVIGWILVAIGLVAFCAGLAIEHLAVTLVGAAILFACVLRRRMRRG